MKYMNKVLFMSDWLKSVWVHLVQFENVFDVEVSKRYSSYSSELISAKFYENIGSQMSPFYQLTIDKKVNWLFLFDLAFIKKMMAL